jgi:hypothetical protein
MVIFRRLVEVRTQVILVYNKIMKLYHGSRYNLEKINNRQASNLSSNKKQTLNGIYLTPDYEFAIAMASRPRGNNNIDNTNKVIKFGNPELFNPEKDIYIYTFDSENISTENLQYIDKLQYVVTGENELIPLQKETLKARELLKYYKTTN